MIGPLTEFELARHDWSALPVMKERAAEVPDRLRNLLTATGPAVVDVLLADGGLARPAQILVLELLHQIVRGVSHTEAFDRGSPDLGDQCRQRARAGIWLLYEARRWHGAQDVLEVIENDAERLAAHIDPHRP